MSRLQQIKTPILTEMSLFEEHFKKSLKSEVPLLDLITNFIIRRKGKQMRPMFVFLSAKMHGEVSQASYVAATLIELLHTATLIHDDVVDESFERRNLFSVNALWRSKVAVLIGDYLLAQGLLESVKNNQYQLLETVSLAVKEMSEGELLQIQTARNSSITEDKYLKIISKKTASLIAACTKCGSQTTTTDPLIHEHMHFFGLQAGIAFQMKDDLFAFETNASGKPMGNDLKEQKLTLPLIYTLQQIPSSQKREIWRLLRSDSTTPTQLKEIAQLVHEKGGIDYTRERMHEYKNSAIEIIKKYPQNDSAHSLQQLVEYSIDRNK